MAYLSVRGRGAAGRLGTVLALLAGLMAAGCVSDRPGVKYRDFAPDAQGKAVVVIGAALAHPPERYRDMFIPHDKLGTIQFGKLTPGRQSLEAPGDQYLGLSGVVQEPKFFVLEVQPGTYMLESITEAGGGKIERTVATRPSATLLQRNTPDVNLRRLGVPWFDVKAGEIVSVGLWVVDTTQGAAKLVRIGRDDAGARAALQRFPSIAQSPTFRLPSGIDPALTEVQQ